MIPAPPRVRLLVVGMAAAFVLAACSVARPPAAVIDGEPITDAQLEGDLARFELLASLTGGSCGQPARSETAESACARFTLSNLIRESLIRRFASDHSLSVTDAAVTDALEQLESSIGAEAVDASLDSTGLTREDLRGFAARLLLFGEVQRAVAAEEVTDEELRRMYEDNQAQYTQFHSAHILVETEAEALEIRERATNENFAKLASRFSIDPGTAENGGDLGTVPATAGFDPAFLEAALALLPGEISQPVQTQFGWHVIHLISVDVTPFEQVRQQLLDQASAQAFDDWLSDRLASADIVVNPKYGRLDEATGQVLPIRSTATGSPAPSGPPPSP
ncbi:MAG: peptidyl-prolyl cis-trans isomerase [Actinomycetota bacterium]